MSEFETRKRFIDADLRMLGWEFSQNRKRNCVEIELEVMACLSLSLVMAKEQAM